MTIRRQDDAVLLDDVCAVEDAETLMQELRAGAAVIDWSGCTHLHTACLQVILAAAIPIRGSPANPAIVRWIIPLLQSRTAPVLETEAAETPNICLTEA